MGMEAKWQRRIVSDGTTIMGRVGLKLERSGQILEKLQGEANGGLVA
jgi:hypothetical protein